MGGAEIGIQPEAQDRGCLVNLLRWPALYDCLPLERRRQPVRGPRRAFLERYRQWLDRADRGGISCRRRSGFDEGQLLPGAGWINDPLQFELFRRTNY